MKAMTKSRARVMLVAYSAVIAAVTVVFVVALTQAPLLAGLIAAIAAISWLASRR